MKIVEPAVEAVQIADPLKKVEYVARVCTDSYRKMTAVSAQPFCEKLLQRKHFSPFEHFRGKIENYFCVMHGAYGVFDRIAKRGDHLYVNGRDFLACSDGRDLDSFAALEEADDYLTLKFTIDSGIARELIRHRQMSFMERSTRYCNMQGGIEFVRPRPFR